jgi:DNA-binding transcriptional LysR family regulator
MRYDLTDLQLFCAVAQSGSLSQAAERVHLAPASASVRIRHLEEAAGNPLFERHPRGLSLTRAGEAMQRHARQVLSDVAALDVELVALADPTSSPLRLFANTNALGGSLARELADFIASHPQIDLQIEERPNAEIARAVSEGIADVGILAGEVGASDLAFLPYRSDPLVLICALGHPLAGRPSVHFTETLTESFVSLGAGSAIHAFLIERSREAGRSLRIRANLNSFDAVCRMVAAGVGMALVPRAMVAATGLAASLSVVPLAESWAVREMRLCFRREGSSSPSRQELIACLTLASPGPDA